MTSRPLTAVALLLAVLAASCDEPAVGPQAHPGTPADAGPVSSDAGEPPRDAGVVLPDAGPPVRTVMEDDSLFGLTSVNNLLPDPLFKGGYSSLSFFPLGVSRNDVTYTWAVPWESATPSRTSGTVALAPGTSYRVVLISLFSGGRGPFRADVWATTAAADGRQVATPGDVTVQVGEAWLGQDPGPAVYNLEYVVEDDVIRGGVTWFHYRATIPGDLPSTVVFVISGTRPGRDLLAAGPQVVPEALLPSAPPVPARSAVPAASRGWPGEVAPAVRFALERRPSLDKPVNLRGGRR